MALIFKYDPANKLGYGLFTCPDCGSEFYGGGPAMHDEGCSVKGYDGLTYSFGPKEMESIKSLGYSPLGPVSLTKDEAEKAKEAYQNQSAPQP